MHEWLGYLLDRLKNEQPVIWDVDGQTYAVQENGTLGAAVRDLAPQWIKPTFEASTLGALAELYRASLDDFEPDSAFHVVDYRNVRLVRLKADEYGHRHVYAQAKYGDETAFRFNQFQAPDKFMIDFRSSFYWNDEAVKVCTLVSHLESSHSISVADDGLSQKIEITQETRAGKIPVTLPAEGVPLIPWRTFREAAPVESRFLLRLAAGAKDAPPNVALFEIDQKWKLDTVLSVAAWLHEQLPEARVIA
jgi:hypothetical protein